MRGSTVLRSVAKKLEAVTPDAHFEAKELVIWALAMSEQQFRRDDPELTEEQLQILNAAVEKRMTGYPLQYLIGSWDFYGKTYQVGPGVLIPRADTEALVECAAEFLKSLPVPKVLDLCSGSGCIAITLSSLCPTAKIYALEKESAAFSYLEENLKKLNSPVIPILDDALNPSFSETDFDLIVSNPPYLSEDDRRNLQREVSFEPESALFDGGDGLRFYRELTPLWKSRLKNGGMLAYEIGMGQEPAVIEILSRNGFHHCKTAEDLSGIIRVVAGIK